MVNMKINPPLCQWIYSKTLSLGWKSDKFCELVWESWLTLESRFAIKWVYVSVYGRCRLAMYVCECALAHAVRKYVYFLQHFPQRLSKICTIQEGIWGEKSELLEAVRHQGKRNLHFTWTLTVGHWQREGTGLVKSNEIFMYFMR